MTDVSVCFWPPCWSPSGWTPAWRIHTNLYKFGQNISSHVLLKKYCRDLNLGEGLCTFILFLFPDSGIYLLNDFFFVSSISNDVTMKISNWTEWSTIQGVVARVISKLEERERRGQFQIKSTITR